MNARLSAELDHVNTGLTPERGCSFLPHGLALDYQAGPQCGRLRQTEQLEVSAGDVDAMTAVARTRCGFRPSRPSISASVASQLGRHPMSTSGQKRTPNVGLFRQLIERIQSQSKRRYGTCQPDATRVTRSGSSRAAEAFGISPPSALYKIRRIKKTKEVLPGPHKP